MLSRFISEQRATNASLIFEKLAVYQRRDIANQLLGVDSVRLALGRATARSDIPRMLRLVYAVSNCNSNYGAFLLNRLGSEHIVMGLIQEPLPAEVVARCLELTQKVDRMIGRRVVLELADLQGQEITNPVTPAVRNVVSNSHIAERLRVSADAREYGVILKAVSRNNRRLAALLVSEARSALWATSSRPSSLVDNAPLSALLSVLRALQLSDPREARRLMRALDPGVLAAAIARRFGTGAMEPVLGLLFRVDPDYTSELLSYFDDGVLSTEDILHTSTIGQLSDDLEALCRVAPPLAAHLLGSMELVQLDVIFESESDLRNIGRAIRKLGHVNLVHTRRLLRRLGSERLAARALDYPAAYAVGRFLFSLAEVEYSLAVQTVRQIPAARLSEKVPSRRFQLTSHAILVRGIAAVDGEKADYVYQERWPFINAGMDRELSIGDAAQGFHFLAVALPARGLELLEQRRATVRGLLTGSPLLEDLTVLLAAIRDCARLRPEISLELLGDRTDWLAEQARAEADPEWLGKYLSVLADIQVEASQRILENEHLWNSVLSHAHEIGAAGKISELLYGIAKAEAATSPRVLTDKHQKKVEALFTSLEEWLYEPRTMLATRLLNAAARVRATLPDVVDAFVQRVDAAGVLPERAQGARNCQEMTFFLKSVSRAASTSPDVLTDLVASIASGRLSEVINRERLVWRVVWLNNALTDFAKSGVVQQDVLQRVWEDVDYEWIASRLIWERRLNVGAILLRQLQQDISERAARSLLRSVMAQMRTIATLERHVASSKAVGAADLLLIAWEVLGIEARPLWMLVSPHIERMTQGATSREAAWLASAVVNFDAATATDIVAQELSRKRADPMDRALLSATLAAASPLSGASPDLRPSIGEMQSYLTVGGADLLDASVAVRRWWPDQGRALLEQCGTQLIEDDSRPGDEELFTELDKPLDDHDVASLRWTLRDHWWGSSVRWIDPEENSNIVEPSAESSADAQ